VLAILWSQPARTRPTTAPEPRFVQAQDAARNIGSENSRRSFPDLRLRKIAAESDGKPKTEKSPAEARAAFREIHQRCHSSPTASQTPTYWLAFERS